MILEKFLIVAFITTSIFASAMNSYEKKCGVCHGKDGKTLAMGKSKAIKGMPKDEVIKALKDYADGSRKSIIVVKTMKKSYLNTQSPKEVEELAEYINNEL